MPQPKGQPPQHQEHQPGQQGPMTPQPHTIREDYRGSGKLENRVAIVTGGDSGIGRSVAVHFAREGADLAIAYLEEHQDADETKRMVEAEGRRCLTFAGDVGQEAFCRDVVEETIRAFGRLDVLVNNAAVQYPQENFENISEEQLVSTFRTNIFAHFFMSKASLRHMKEGSSIICTTSITAYRGNPMLIDYSSTKGAIVTFVRSLSQHLAGRKIRVNGVAPGPIWTPLIPSTFSAEHVEKFGSKEPLGRVGQPEEVAPSYVFLASADASYMTGQVLHPNGGEVVNG